MQILQDAEDEYGVLGEENLTEQGERPGGTETAGKDEVALHHRLECELKGERREKTLESLEYTLNHIFIQDRDLRYRLPEREDMGMAAEENVLLF